MDAAQIRSLKPELRMFLQRFDDCFQRSDTRGHLSVYVEGQLSDLPRKSCEPIADAQGIAPRTLQQFLSLLDWDHGLMKTKLQQLVAEEHASPHSIGIIDETACPKKGEKTPGVQRQWCGATGKQDNCVVTVHLGYAVDDFHCLIDSELFLPESWSNDRPRCQRAEIPDGMQHRPKTNIALELYDRARSNGVSFAWLTFDEGYGKSPAVLDELRARGQNFVAEVPVTCTGWIEKPRVTTRRRSPRGRPASGPRLVQGSPPFCTVREMLEQEPELRDQPWQAWHVKDGEKGPQVWEVKHVWFYPRGVDGLPQEGSHLIVARNVLEPTKLKFFVAHAPRETSLGVLLKVAFSRWRVERCFEDEKTELGFDHFEGRSYVGLMRHQIITALTHLFLARTHQAWREKKSGVDCVPGARRGRRAGAIVVAHRRQHPTLARTDGRKHQQNPTPQRSRSKKPPQTHDSSLTQSKYHAPKTTQVPVG
jgi:SRSO17 transposase